MRAFSLVFSHSLDEETPVESQSNGPYLTSGGTHCNFVVFFVLKAASGEHNVIRVLCGDIDCRLPARVLRVHIQVVHKEKDPLHQICMQEPHCQVPSIAGHGLSYWLWYRSLLVGQRECISSEHFSEGFLSRTWAEYLVVLVQLMLIWWKLYTLLSVC